MANLLSCRIGSGPCLSSPLVRVLAEELIELAFQSVPSKLVQHQLSEGGILLTGERRFCDGQHFRDVWHDQSDDGARIIHSTSLFCLLCLKTPTREWFR